MIEWKETVLGDIATFYNGYAFKPTDWSTTGNEIIRIQNLTKGAANINYFEGELPEKYRVVKGDILISWSGSLGVYEWKKEDSWLNQHLFKVVFDKEELDKLFFKYLMRISLLKLESQVHGATMKHITKKKFDAFPVSIPPLPQQKKIAAILDAADAYRQKTKALIAKYEELTQSLFLDMFGDPVGNPKGWEAKELKEVGIVNSGITKGRKLKEELSIGERPYMRVANVQDGYLDLKEVKTIPAIKSDLDKFLLLKGDVLLTEGGDPDKLGRGAVWNEEVTGCLHQNHIFRVRLNKDVLTPIYFSKLTGSIYGKRYFLKVGKQTTGIATINKTQLTRFPVLIPPIDLQNQFAERVQKIETQKAQAQASIKKAEDLFNSLLQKAFKGELI